MDSASKPGWDCTGIPAWIAAAGAGTALAMYAYLGTFSRHLADDFCSIGFVRGNFLRALWQNYQTISDRFSNYGLIALSEFLSPRSVGILPGLMIVLWIAGIGWLLIESLRLGGAAWPRPVLAVLALTFVFQALLQAPNLHQTLYWRSAMATHFAPLVLSSFFAAFLVRMIASASRLRSPRALYPLVYLLAVLLGGFSEPPLFLMIALLGGSLVLAVWLRARSPKWKAVLPVLAWALAGALTTLLIMILAPANSLRLGTPPPPLPVLLARSFEYALEFMRNSIRTLPLPTLVGALVPGIALYGVQAPPAARLDVSVRKRVVILLAITPMIVYLLIVATFAPSVYGQSFPIERARFAGQVCLVAGSMVAGGAAGILLAQWRPKVPEARWMRWIPGLLLLVLTLYPLRAAWRTLAEVPEYRARARFWDLRDAYIRRHASAGEREIIVPGSSGVHGIKELDLDADHWVNQCAAAYYRVESIIAVAIPDAYIPGYLNE